MLPLRPDNHGVLGLTIANLGLFLASGLLLAVILGGVYGSLWERTAELRTTADTLNTYVETLSAAYNDSRLVIPIVRGLSLLHMTSSTESLRVSAQGSFGTTLTITERWTCRPWPRNNSSWQSGVGLHQWLNMTYGHAGTVEDPVNQTTLNALEETHLAALARLARTPVEFNCALPLFAENVIIYTPQDQVAFVLLYQTESVHTS
jgi:hypothetical protein